MTRSQNHDASSSKKLNASHNNASATWANLNQDLLLLIVLQLGVVDFFSFKRVCKSWRKLAFDHNDMFMGSRQPMSISFSTGAKKECYLEDFEGRKFKTILPHSIGSTCVGITCGYVILFGRKTRDFWLVNPITRHEFHFPSFPFYVSTDTASIRAILVNVPSMSGWVFVITHRFSSVISFSLAGNQPSWNSLNSKFPIHDLHFFKGKIYTIDSGCHLYELRLNPEPTLRLLAMTNIPEPILLRPEFVNSDQNLFVIDCILKDVYESHEVDFDEMKWVSTDKTIREDAFFVGDLKSGAVINPETWVDPQTQYEGFRYSHGTGRSENKGGWFTAIMWYFPHDCVNVD